MTISILGCGWLGLPLAEHLIQQGHTVKGSTTSPNKIHQLKARSVQPFILKLEPELPEDYDLQDFWDADVLVLNIPPGRRRENVIDYHTRQIRTIIEEITGSQISHVVFISSTSVYPKYPGTVTEGDTIPNKAGRDSGNALLRAEHLLMTSDNFETTIIRFGGLLGGNRHPAKYLAKRKNLGRANARVNLIHRKDCIQIITQIIEENITGEIFNAVSDEHPTRKHYYRKAARSLGLEPPSFQPDEEANYKVVSNKKLKDRLGYSFIYPNLLLYLNP